MAFKRPDYPSVLTKTNWDKNKGLAAKMAGATGVGEALSKLESAYKAVDWKKFEIAANKPNPFSLPKLEAMKKAAIAEMNGNAAKLRAAAFAARDAAKKAGGELKKNPLTKGAGGLCDQIEKAADFLGVGANSNSIGGYIQKDVDEAKSSFDFTVKSIKTNIPARVSALKNAIKAAGNPTTPKLWKAAAMMTKCRDLNQLIGNVPKLTEMGYDLGMDTGKAKSFFEDMRVYASKECPFEENKPDDAKKALAAVNNLAQRAAVF
ncbi:MAG: hypothetical protein K8R60_05115 [Burkholderiales bacterium]|nr:hypothetical protein [Burkholderiales bacterium]